MRGHLSPAILRRLQVAARRAAKQAYAPYSRFRVGAAVLTDTGKIFPGCNVENASYGLSNCAERSAIFSAVSAGEQSIMAVMLYTPTAAPVTPCGACRQVINEFGPRAMVFGTCDSQQRTEASLAELLPGAFGPANLRDSRQPVVRRVR